MIQRGVGPWQRLRSRQIELLAVVNVEGCRFVVKLFASSANSISFFFPSLSSNYTNKTAGRRERQGGVMAGGGSSGLSSRPLRAYASSERYPILWCWSSVCLSFPRRFSSCLYWPGSGWNISGFVLVYALHVLRFPFSRYVSRYFLFCNVFFF